LIARVSIKAQRKMRSQQSTTYHCDIPRERILFVPQMVKTHSFDQSQLRLLFISLGGIQTHLLTSESDDARIKQYIVLHCLVIRSSCSTWAPRNPVTPVSSTYSLSNSGIGWEGSDGDERSLVEISWDEFIEEDDSGVASSSDVLKGDAVISGSSTSMSFFTSEIHEIFEIVRMLSAVVMH